MQQGNLNNSDPCSYLVRGSEHNRRLSESQFFVNGDSDDTSFASFLWDSSVGNQSFRLGAEKNELSSSLYLI